MAPHATPASENGKLNQPPTSPFSKQVRCSEFDLEIVVGDEKESFLYYAVNLAQQSTYIDAALSSMMREGKTKRLSFPDITPDEWTLMLSYLDQPVTGKAPKLPNYREIERLATLYDKYSFENGLYICDRLLCHQFGASLVLRDCALAAYIYSVAYKCSLPKTKKKCLSVFENMFKGIREGTGCCNIAKRRVVNVVDALVNLEEDRFKLLVPMIATEDRLWNVVNSLLLSPLPPEARDTLEDDHCFSKLVLTSLLWRLDLSMM